MCMSHCTLSHQLPTASLVSRSGVHDRAVEEKGLPAKWLVVAQKHTCWKLQCTECSYGSGAVYQAAAATLSLCWSVANLMLLASGINTDVSLN